MSNDERQRQMDFILNQQAAFSSDMIELKSQMVELKSRNEEQNRNLDKLAGIVERLAETVEVHRQETQEAINNLIIANEATRELANKAAELAFNTSRRLTVHENKPHPQE